MNRKRILLDASTAIRAYDEGASDPKALIDEAKAKVRDWVEKDTELVTSAPILYEVLRGVSPEKEPRRWRTLKEAMDAMTDIEIRRQHGEQAASLYRTAKAKGMVPDKRSFDILHIATAWCEKLEFSAEDDDFKRLEALLPQQENA